MSQTVTRVEKPWGYELHWAKTDRYVGKLIHINAGHALSLQYHNQKDETIFLWAGKLLFEIKEGEELKRYEVSPGQPFHVTPGTVHRMTAIEDCDVFEVSTPELDDVVRLEDRYGRTQSRIRAESGSVRMRDAKVALRSRSEYCTPRGSRSNSDRSELEFRIPNSESEWDVVLGHVGGLAHRPDAGRLHRGRSADRIRRRRRRRCRAA